MTKIQGYLYLHTNGSLIYKRYLDNAQEKDFRESDFVLDFWTIYEEMTKAKCFLILEEAYKAGATLETIRKLYPDFTPL